MKHFLQKYLLYVIIFGFTLGVLIRSVFQIDWVFNLEFSLLFIFLSLIILIFLFLKKKEKSILLFIPIFVLFFGIGVLRYEFAVKNNGDQLLNSFIDEKVKIKGLIIENPDKRATNTKLTVSVKTIEIEGKDYTIDSKILITTDPYWEYNYGQKVLIYGKLQQPKNFETDTGRIFDYVSYLGKDDIFYQMMYADIEIISEDNGSLIKKYLFKIKKSLIFSLDRLIPQPESALMSGEIFGEKSALSKDLQEDFRKTGIIHIVVLSGYNVTIVADALVRIFSFLPSVIGLTFGSLGIILFAILTGAGATVIRASIMALLVIFARMIGRESNVVRILFLAGFFMLIHNPKILLFDMSFQLSFLATFGLIYISPILEKKLSFISEKFQFRSNALATISTQIFVLPLLLYYMGELSIVAVPVNMLILFVIPITMLFGFMTAILGLASKTIAVLMAVPTYFLLHYQLKIVELFASLKFVSISVPNVSGWFVVLLYVIILIWIFRMKSKEEEEV